MRIDPVVLEEQAAHTVKYLEAPDSDSNREVVHAKFLLGADGAHSWVRKIFGIRRGTVGS